MFTTIEAKNITKLAGSAKEQKEALLVAIIMLIVTFLYEGISLFLIPEFRINWFEFGGTWAGLTCVWLARTQNVLTWPWGILSAALLGYFFMTIGLPGQQWLNWGYFLIIQLWAWPIWVWGGTDKSPLAVTSLSVFGRGKVLIAIAIGTVGVYGAIEYISPGSSWPLLDSVVVASSIVAQYLLGKKKVESWFLWLGPVNLLSIGLFFVAGAYTVMALYVAFFVHAYLALLEWRALTKIT